MRTDFLLNWLLAIAVCTVIALLMALLGRWCARRAPRWGRIALASLAVLMCAAIAAATVLAGNYPGPESRYIAGSREDTVRGAIAVAGLAAFLLPLWTTLGLASLGSHAWRTHKAMTVAIGVVAFLMCPAAIVVTLIVGCNIAGACL